jgi:hypothetical protein
MCRSIKTLRNAETPVTDDEVTAAALQFVRKISGYRVPSAANREAFDRAVTDITDASRYLLDKLVVSASRTSPSTRRSHEHVVPAAGAVPLIR